MFVEPKPMSAPEETGPLKFNAGAAAPQVLRAVGIWLVIGISPATPLTAPAALQAS
jgi:hypothetical protein